MAIIKRSNKKGMSYCVRERDEFGRWFPSRTFSRVSDAKRYQRELLARKDDGYLAKSKEVRNLSFERFVDFWAEECRSHVSEGWKTSQDQMLRDHIKPIIGELKLGSIKRREISQVLKLAQEKGLGAQTRVHIYNLLNKIFDDAIVHFEYIRVSPVVKTLKPSIPIEERKYLKPEESFKVLEASRNKWFGTGVWICLLTGMRISELQALTWECVDFKKKQILIKGSYCRKEKKLQNYTKQRKWGRVPMTPDLVSFLSTKRFGKRDEDFVLESYKGGMLKYHSFSDGLKRLTKETGVTQVSVHELRHSCTELFISNGATAEDVRRLLNQSSLTATSRYIHKTHERLEGIAGKITLSDQLQVS